MNGEKPLAERVQELDAFSQANPTLMALVSAKRICASEAMRYLELFVSIDNSILPLTEKTIDANTRVLLALLRSNLLQKVEQGDKTLQQAVESARTLMKSPQGHVSSHSMLAAAPLRSQTPENRSLTPPPSN